MIPETIKKFSQQLSFNPVIENASKLRSAKSFIIAGMGGSHLAADLLKTWDPSAPIIVHSNYALPHLSIEELKQSLIIASSYSGNTEETIDSFEKARSRKLKVAAISTGGKLLKLAKKYDIPFIRACGAGIAFARGGICKECNPCVESCQKIHFLKDLPQALSKIKKNQRIDK